MGLTVNQLTCRSSQPVLPTPATPLRVISELVRDCSGLDRSCTDRQSSGLYAPDAAPSARKGRVSVASALSSNTSRTMFSACTRGHDPTPTSASVPSISPGAVEASPASSGAAAAPEAMPSRRVSAAWSSGYAHRHHLA